MKSTTLPKPRLNPLHCLIQDATHAPASDLAQIENIMRDEIFHSTLDWQTREQLADAARQAFARLNDNRELYEFGRASALAVFHQMRAASAPNH
jgi:hypothetical protein